MTLPRGFGRGLDEPTEPPKRCKLGKKCDDNYPDYERCNVHEWTHDHDDAWMLIRILLVVVIGSLVIIGIVVVYDAQWQASHEIIYRNIEGFNCNQLAEYVADKSESYRYAEHRYEWLCVNEQVEEFST